jgi:thioredoxin reductase (NADPH)
MLDMIIIGAGPAGISMAVEARNAGVAADRLLVLERAEEHSFTLKKYYPDEKLVTANYKGFDAVCTGVMCMPDLSKNETISYLDKSLADHDVRVRYRENVFRIHKEDGEQRFTVFTDTGSYDTKVVAIAIGILGKPNKPDYQLPRTLKEKLLFDITTRPIQNASVLVVGGGDSASEYCQYLAQKQNRVTMSYRRHDFSRMNDINRQSLLTLAETGAVEVLYGSTIEKVTDDGGRPAIHFQEAQYGVRTYDYVLYALGGSTPENFLKMIGIEFDGPSPELREGHETSVPGLFLVGDLSAGPKGGSIIWAFNSANTAMRRICKQYLGA